MHSLGDCGKILRNIDKNKYLERHAFMIAIVIVVILIVLFAFLRIIAFITREDNSIDDGNPYISITTKPIKRNFYELIFKPVLSELLSFLCLVILSPLFAALCLAVYIDDPGPVFFKQKRIGKDKHFFYLHKFRTMKMSAPHDVPTHMLKNPDEYITKVGKFLRKTSLDELSQTWDIFRGKMHVVSPRPALWNQADLVAERDKYDANSVKPGLTGWAQINGRDELEIPVKAKLDGIYIEKLRKSGFGAFLFDCRCFLGTIFSVLRGDGVVEGGTGALKSVTNEKNLNVDDHKDGR